MLQKIKYRICPTFQFRSCGSDTYLYRSRDQVAWDSGLAAEPLFWEIWSGFKTENYLSSVTDGIQDGYEKDDALSAMEGLIECGILEPVDENTRPLLDSLLNESVFKTARETISFHLTTSRIKWIDYSNGEDIKERDHHAMDKKISEESIPDHFKKAANSTPRYDLSDLVPQTLFPVRNKADVIFGSRREPYEQKISIDIINFLINHSVATAGSVCMYGTGDHPTKPVPSGGARHPIESYFIVGDGVEGIERGLYHYNVKHHRLDEIEISSRNLDKLFNAATVLPRSRNKKPAFAVLHSCIFSRSMFRYREPRSYRVMHFDLGHVHANEIMICRMLGLDFNESYSVPESVIESTIGLDPLFESIMSSFIVYQG